MTKQELLTKLATECKTWKEAVQYAQCIAASCNITCKAGESAITKQYWLAERERLLNKPGWTGVPEEVTHKAMDADGRHHFFIGEPHQGAVRLEWFPEPVSDGGWVYRAGKAIAIPAGYDWRDSLEVRPV